MSIESDQSPFGGKRLIEAADPLQNAPIVKGKQGSISTAPFYESETFYNFFHVGLLMDESTNHRFANRAWIAMLNRMRCNSFRQGDVQEFHRMVNCIENTRTTVNEPLTTLQLLMDLVNSLIVRDEYEAEYSSHGTAKGLTKLDYMAKKKFIVRQRLEQHYAVLDELKGLPSGYYKDLKLHLQKPDWKQPKHTTNEELFRYYKLYSWNMDHILQFKILCTEKRQAEMYDLVYSARQAHEFNVQAVDSIKAFLPDGKEIFSSWNLMKQNDPDAYTILYGQADQKLKAIVNLKCRATDGDLSARRVINDNRAGEFLVAGMAVEILEYDKANQIVTILPLDVTGQDLCYQPVKIKQVSETFIYKNHSTGVSYVLTRNQFPICNGFATVVNSVAGLTFKNTKIVLDNTRTITEGAFYIFCGRAVNPINIYLRFALDFEISGDTEKVFEIKTNASALRFDKKAKELYEKYKHYKTLVIPAKLFKQ
jgi:hypothetical protein